MNTSKLAKSIGLAIVLFVSSSALSNRDGIYEGKIEVINHSSHPIKLGIYGDNCVIALYEVAAQGNFRHSCQEISMANNTTRTFYLDEANVKGSNNLWIEMKFPEARSPNTPWICFNRTTKHYVRQGDQTFKRNRNVRVEIMAEDYSTLNSSMKCQIDNID